MNNFKRLGIGILIGSSVMTIQAAEPPASTPAVQSYESATFPAAPQPAVASAVAPAASTALLKEDVKALTTAELNQQAALAKQYDMLHEKIADLSQSVLMIQQRINEHMDMLDQKTGAMQQEIETLVGLIKTINAQMNNAPIKVIPTPVIGERNESDKLFATAIKFFENVYLHYSTVVLVGIGIVAIGLGFLFRGAPKQIPASVQPSPLPKIEDMEDEYDFMGSQESIPAKSDLVRAYIAMEDFDAASHVLQEILKKGTSSQRAEARELFNRIPAKA